PQGGVHPVEGDGGKLAVRRRPPDSATGTENRCQTKGEGGAVDGDARHPSRATGAMARIATSTGRGTASPAENLPSRYRTLCVRGQESERDRPPTWCAGRDRGRATRKGETDSGEAAPPPGCHAIGRGVGGDPRAELGVGKCPGVGGVQDDRGH